MEEYTTLPSMEHRFQINIVGEESKVNYAGSFIYRRPTLGEKSQVERIKTTLGGDLANLDIQIQNLNYMLAYLRTTLQESPDWWIGSQYGQNLMDFNVIDSIYSECLKFEERWKEKLNEKSEKPKFVRTETKSKTDNEADGMLGEDEG